MAEILNIVGKIAGIGGLGIGVFLLLFREVIRKNIFSSLTKEQSYKLVRLFLILVWSIALLGIVAWIFTEILQRKENSHISGINEDTSIPKTIDLLVTYAYKPQEEDNFKELADGSILKSGDFYKIKFTPVEDGYVYIFQTDNTGRIFQLFPMATFEGNNSTNQHNPVYARTSYYIPGKNTSMVLDDSSGKERIYMFAFKERDELLESYYHKLQIAIAQHNDQNIQIAQEDFLTEINKRETIDTVTWKLKGNDFSLLSKRLANCEDCLDRVTFAHQ